MASGKVRCLGIAFFLCCAFTAASLQAGIQTIPPPFPDVPYPPVADITSSYTAVVYSSSAGAFSAQGEADSLALGLVRYAISPDVSGGLFDLSATFDPVTGTPLSGTLAITGNIPDLGYGGPNLLTGALTAFGSDTDYGPLEFIFNVTGGQLQSLYGSQVEVDLSEPVDPSYGDPITFTTDFSNYGLGESDSYALVSTPEPSALVTAATLMLLSGLVYLVRSRFASKLTPAQNPQLKFAQRP